MSFLPMSGLL